MNRENPDSQEVNSEKFKKARTVYSAYLKYATMGIQMAIIIAAFSFLGVKLDEFFACGPWLTVVCSLSGVALSLYFFIKKVLSEKS